MKTRFSSNSTFFHKAIVFLFAFMGVSAVTNAQFFDELANPQVTVKITHPPGLGLKVNKVAFNPSSGNLSSQAVDALIQDFVNNNVDVIDRQNLNAILSEHDLNASGYIDKASAVAIGKIIGPSALITVKVLRGEIKNENLKGSEKKYNAQTKQNYLVNYFIAKATFFLKISIQTVDLTTGRIFSAQMLDYSPSRENKSYEGIPQAPSEFELQELALNWFTKDVHKMFFTWTEPTTLYFFDDKEGGLKDAFKALKGGNNELAYKLSMQNLESCKQMPGIKPKILAHAYYNAGMSYMINNEYDKAIDNFQEAQRLRPGDIVKNAIADCIKAETLNQELQRVDEKAAFESQKIDNTAKAQEKSTLRNEDIITLTQKKLPTALIITKIKTTDCKFDTSTDALVKLSEAGVNDDVLMEMMNKK